MVWGLPAMARARWQINDYCKRAADLPVVAEWIDHAAQAPPIRFLHCLRVRAWALPAGNRPHDHEGLSARRDGVGQRGIHRFVR